MKINKDKHNNFLKALCRYYRLDYWEFIRPSKSPEYLILRSIVIYYYKKHKIRHDDIANLFGLDQSTVTRNYKYAKQRVLTTEKGKVILKTTENIIFRQCLGSRPVSEQIIYERISKK